MVYNISQNNSINPTLVSLDFIYAVNNLLELEETKTMAWNTALYQMLNIAEFQSTICWTMVEWHTLVVTSSVWLWMWWMWEKPKSILSSLLWLNGVWKTLRRLLQKFVKCDKLLGYEGCCVHVNCMFPDLSMWLVFHRNVLTWFICVTC